jgi:hypothetical protein
MSQITKQLAVIRNPFDDATLDPKIPDGRATTSVGVRLQAVADVELGTNTTNILLYPGLGSVVYASDVLQGNSTTPSDYILPINSSVDINQTGTSGVDLKFVQNEANVASRWRLVSSGMKITTVNDNGHNGGWWEAIRFSPTVEDTAYALQDGTLTVPTSQLFDKNKSVAGENLISHNNYMTGQLRDLHKYMFYLQHNEPESEWVQLSTELDVEGNPLDKQNAVDQYWDHQNDVVLLRIHGRATDPNATSSPCCRGTRLMIHAVANHEYQYQTSSPMARLQTRGHDAGQRLDAAVRQINNDQHAAMVVTPTKPREAAERRRKSAPKGSTSRGTSKKSKK